MINLARVIISKIESWTGLPIKRAIKFGLVGSSGVIVNQGLLILFTELVQFHYRVSSIIAIEISIINNFIWNNIWTWKDKKTDDSREKKVRFFKYNLISGGLAFINNYCILILLVEIFGLNVYLSNLIGIAFAMGFNFFLNHKWTFKKISL